jgi:hypothetical protein
MIVSVNEDKETEITNTQTANDNWTKAEDAEALARHGISPNHLFRNKRKEATEAKGSASTVYGAKGTAIDESTTVNLTAAENSPNKKRSKSAELPSGMKASN